MSNVLRVSDAATLALHTMAVLARSESGQLSTREIAAMLRASEAHLSKVLQRLAKVGLVKSSRGPKGGFVLGRPADEISLLDVYEAIEGPLASSKCLVGEPVCDGKTCIFGGLLESVNRQIRDHLVGTRLSNLAAWQEGRRLA